MKKRDIDVSYTLSSKGNIQVKLSAEAYTREEDFEQVIIFDTLDEVSETINKLTDVFYEITNHQAIMKKAKVILEKSNVSST